MDSAASSGRWARLHMFTMRVEPRDLDDAKSEQRENYLLWSLFVIGLCAEPQ